MVAGLTVLQPLVRLRLCACVPVCSCVLFILSPRRAWRFFLDVPASSDERLCLSGLLAALS